MLSLKCSTQVIKGFNFFCNTLMEIMTFYSTGTFYHYSQRKFLKILAIKSKINPSVSHPSDLDLHRRYSNTQRRYACSLEEKAMTNLDRILKSRDITLWTKVHIVKAVVFPIVMYGCESWTIKKAERRRIDAFELWCWKRHLRVPWTARRSNQSIQKKISPEHSVEGLMLKLKLQYFGYLIRRTDSLRKTLMLGKIEGRRRRGQQDEMVG